MLILFNKIKIDFSFKKAISLLFSIILSLITVFAIIKPEIFLVYGYSGVLIFSILGGQGVYVLPFIINRFEPSALIILISLGMAINDSFGYLIGRTARKIVLNKFDRRLQLLINKYGMLGVFILSTVPFPISNGLISGLLKVKYNEFFLATFLGKLTLLIFVYIFIVMFR